MLKKDYSNAGLPWMDHFWDLMNSSCLINALLWSSSSCVIPMAGNSIILSIGLSSTFISSAILRAGRKQLNNLKPLIYPIFREVDVIRAGSHLASEHSWVIQTSFHLQPVFDHSETVHSVWALFFLLFLPTASLSIMPYLLTQLFMQEPGKKPLINSSKSI